MNATEDWTIKEFEKGLEKDCYWWVRWYELTSNRLGGTGSPGITVFLSKVSEHTLDHLNKADEFNTSKDFKEYQKNEPTIHIDMHSGVIPLLGLGNIFRNGKLAGCLPFSRVDQSFDTSGDQNLYPAHQIWDNESYQLKKWRTRIEKKDPFCLLNSFEYNLGPCSKNSRFLVLNKNDVDYVFPSIEIFRTFYAWKSKIALEITSGPWKSRLNNIYNLKEGTGKNGDDEWFVRVRTGFSFKDCALLAPLLHDPKASLCANTVFQNAWTSSQPIISAKIPYHFKQLKLSLLGYQIQSNKFLVFQFADLEWPYKPKPKLRLRLDNSHKKGRIILPTQKPKPFSGTNQKNTGEKDVSITSEEDPQVGRGTHNIKTRNMNINGLEYEEQDKDRSYIYEKTPEEENHDETVNVSLGNGVNSITGLHPGNTVSANLPSVHLFDAAQAALEELKQQGKLLFCIVRDDRVKESDRLGCWSFPRVPNDKTGMLYHSSWSLIDGRQRRALVFDIQINNQRLYYMEIEPRGTKCRAIAFTVERLDCRDNAIEEVLKYVVENKGNFHNKSNLEGVWQHCSTLHTRKHAYKDKERKELNPSSLLKLFANVLPEESEIGKAGANARGTKAQLAP